MTGYLQMM